MRGTLGTALDHLAAGERSAANHAIDAALRGAEVGHAVAPRAFEPARSAIRAARRAAHMGNDAALVSGLVAARATLERVDAAAPPPPARLEPYDGARLLNAHGVGIGEVEIEDGQVALRLGGPTDVWGFLDLGARRTLDVPATALLFGPSRALGSTLVVLPTFETPGS